MKTHFIRRLITLIPVALVVAGAEVHAQTAPAAQPQFGGVLKVAMIGEPPTLDLHATTATITAQIMWHVDESLYTFDKDFSPIPLLAEGHAVSDGGRRYTITLRKGVRFHDGTEMTSADVVSSLNRWGRTATVGKALWKAVEALQAKGPYDVVIHLKEPSGVLLNALAGFNAAIYPKAVIDAAGDGQLKEFIGTGPFRFVEHKPDRHIRLARFKGYTARPEPSNGAGGKRTAYFDEIVFVPVPDVALRLPGVVSGSYHYSQQIKQDQYDRILTLRGVEPRIASLPAAVTLILNHKQGLMTGKKMRQALQAALDMEAMLAAAAGHPLFYRVDPALFPPELVLWHSTAGTGAYNQRDKEKARRLLKEAGYAGQPVRLLTNKEYEGHYKTALLAKQQLEDVGFKIDLQVVDWATQTRRWSNPGLFDVASTGFVSRGTDPAFSVILQCSYPGWWCNDEKQRLLGELARETDPSKRKAIIDRIQAIFYEDVGRIKVGDIFGLDVTRKELRGDFRSVPMLFFWNAWLTSKGVSTAPSKPALDQVAHRGR